MKQLHPNLNPIKADLLTVFIFLIIFACDLPCLYANTASPLFPKKEHASQCVKIIRTLERYHYLEKDLDNQMSQAILEKFIKQLDPGKRLFTATNIQQFKRHEFRLDNEIKQGNLSTPFKIANLYIERRRQRLKYIISLLPDWEKCLDFNAKDSIITDHDLRSWSSSQDVLYVFWKKDLKNHIIPLLLDDQEKKFIGETLGKVYKNRLKRVHQINENDIFQIFMNSVASSFDPHTEYFPPRVSEDFDIQMSLSLEGIGAVLQNEYEYIKVVRLIPKGPAEKSSLLMPGDKIIGVGQGKSGEIKDTIGQRIDHVVKLIRGPKNTYVRLKIIPAKMTNSTKTIQIKRDHVKLEDQSAQKKVVEIENNGLSLKIGIIEIPTFYFDFNAFRSGDKNYKSTTRDVKNHIAELKKQGIDGLLIDLRDNGGGSLEEANQLTGLFLKTGPIVQIQTKYHLQRLYDDDPAIDYRGPLIVLINRMSASASEIFAGAIKDYHRGIIVGTRSFGKGTVQQIEKMDIGKLKFTSAKFYRVSGQSTQNLGVEPDIHYPPLYNIEQTGEIALDGTLPPHDATEKTDYQRYRSLYPAYKQLRSKYEKRSMNDPGIRYLKNRKRMASKINAESAISLNIEDRKKRKSEYQAMELDIENEYLSLIGEPPLKDLDENKTQISEIKKILLEQTCLVMADFIHVTNQLGYMW